MLIDTGTNLSRNAIQQNAASIAPASESPWPVWLFVLLINGVASPNTFDEMAGAIDPKLRHFNVAATVPDGRT